MIILGVDPGSHKTGYGLLRRRSEGKLEPIDYGVIKAKSSHDLSVRLTFIFHTLSEVVKQHQPDAMAIEKVFFARDVRSALTLGHARGMALLCAGLQDVAVTPYAATEVKQAVTGSGRASKDQVQKMVKTLLNIQDKILEDASDALAIAICHAHTYRLREYDRVSARANIA